MPIIIAAKATIAFNISPQLILFIAKQRTIKPAIAISIARATGISANIPLSEGLDFCIALVNAAIAITTTAIPTNPLTRSLQLICFIVKSNAVNPRTTKSIAIATGIKASIALIFGFVLDAFFNRAPIAIITIAIPAIPLRRSVIEAFFKANIMPINAKATKSIAIAAGNKANIAEGLGLILFTILRRRPMTRTTATIPTIPLIISVGLKIFIASVIIRKPAIARLIAAAAATNPATADHSIFTLEIAFINRAIATITAARPINPFIKTLISILPSFCITSANLLNVTAKVPISPMVPLTDLTSTFSLFK